MTNHDKSNMINDNYYLVQHQLVPALKATHYPWTVLIINVGSPVKYLSYLQETHFRLLNFLYTA